MGETRCPSYEVDVLQIYIRSQVNVVIRIKNVC